LKKIDLGQAISIVANLGVIAGIVFLGIELRQNNELLTAQASFAQFTVGRERRNRYLGNEGGISDILFKSQTGLPLNERESWHLNFLWADILDSWEWEFRELQAGRLPDDFVDTDNWRVVWRANQGLRERFERDRRILEPDFGRFVEENVVNER